ncbi:polymorphic toxin-type HINT domain-containing protein [Streptomyces anandii]|uniref:Polymorphic toxin-type HINT domain-containing protein n=1 Tax=Streptomyces anandii TaxID=285454 RepID=A0ABW6HCV9_9ACTN
MVHSQQFPRHHARADVRRHDQGDQGHRRTETHTVSRTIHTPDDTDFVDITIDVGHAQITATQHHPFWSPGTHHRIDGGDLRPGQTLRTSSGATVTVLRVHRFHRLHSAYSLTVDSLHTYYVLAGTTPVLVRNTNGCPAGTMVLGIGEHSEALAKEIHRGGIPSTATNSGKWSAGPTGSRSPCG